MINETHLQRYPQKVKNDENAHTQKNAIPELNFGILSPLIPIIWYMKLKTKI